jgi:hypothetical protein
LLLRLLHVGLGIRILLLIRLLSLLRLLLCLLFVFGRIHGIPGTSAVVIFLPAFAGIFVNISIFACVHITA